MTWISNSHVMQNTVATITEIVTFWAVDSSDISTSVDIFILYLSLVSKKLLTKNIFLHGTQKRKCKQYLLFHCFVIWKFRFSLKWPICCIARCPSWDDMCSNSKSYFESDHITIELIVVTRSLMFHSNR